MITVPVLRSASERNFTSRWDARAGRDVGVELFPPFPSVLLRRTQRVLIMSTLTAVLLPPDDFAMDPSARARMAGTSRWR